MEGDSKLNNPKIMKIIVDYKNQDIAYIDAINNLENLGFTSREAEDIISGVDDSRNEE